MKETLKQIYKKVERLLHAKNRGYIPVDENGFWKYRHPPTQSLNETAALFNANRGEIIIEIGTGIHGGLAGNSMLVWTKQTNAKRIIAIDLEQKRLDEVAEHTSQYSNVELELTNGIDFVKQFASKIDLLYLDFWTPDPEGELPGSGRAVAYEEAFLGAKEKMNDRSLILIDDTDHIHPWKHTHIVPLARKEGYSVLYEGRQTLLSRA